MFYVIFGAAVSFIAGWGIGWGLRGIWKRNRISFYCSCCRFLGINK